MKLRQELFFSYPSITYVSRTWLPTVLVVTVKYNYDVLRAAHNKIRRKIITKNKMKRRRKRSSRKEKLQLDPLLPAPPIDTSTFPSSRWSYDDTSRVLLGVFNNNHHLDREDLIFLLKMMERDDITVVTEGFARLNTSLWTLATLSHMVGDSVCHQFRVFRRVMKVGSNEKCCYESFEELGECCDMFMKDYFRYIQLRRDQLKCIANRILLANQKNATLCTKDETIYRNKNDELFTYKSYKNDQTYTLNCIDTILYLIDYDLGKFLPMYYEDFMSNYAVPQILPGSPFCLMHEVSFLKTFSAAALPNYHRTSQKQINL